jgi:uncharacterized delta-60 repeat protein
VEVVGSLDNTFDEDGKVLTLIGGGNTNLVGANSVVIQSDGKIVVGGTSRNSFLIVRYNSNGSIDNTFDGDGIALFSLANTGIYSQRLNTVAIQSDGKILAVDRLHI